MYSLGTYGLAEVAGTDNISNCAAGNSRANNTKNVLIPHFILNPSTSITHPVNYVSQQTFNTVEGLLLAEILMPSRPVTFYEIR